MDYLLLVLVFCGGAFLGKYLPSYLSQKGKNLATQEDIGKITREVEQVKSEYTERLEGIAQQNRSILEHMRYRNQLRLAALDRRLQAHQEAYALLLELRGTIHTSGLGDVVGKCQEWWDKNCLYLEEDARKKFLLAYRSASNHPELLKQPRLSSPDETVEALKQNWKGIEDALEAIVKGVALPSLGEEEYRRGNSSGDGED